MMDPVSILIADDDALVRQIAMSMLQATGYAVRTAASGNAAASACAEHMPHIVMLDVEMPDGDGYAACAAIRALPGGEHVPIVMVTGLDDPASIEYAYELGATDFIVKPINWPLLAHRIRYVLRGARTIEALRVSEQQNRTLIEGIPDGLYLLDAHGAIEHRLHPVDCLEKGASDRHLTAPAFVELLPASAQAIARESLRKALEGTPAAFEFAVETEGAPSRHFECRYLPNPAARALAILREVTQRKEAEAHIHRLAYFDTLTALPNREWLAEYLAKALEAARRDDRTVAVLYLDLDQFKRINDTLGHDTGDALLRQVAARVTSVLTLATGNEEGRAPAQGPSVPDGARVSGRLTRVGGDEFIAVLTGHPTLCDAEEVARRVQTSLESAFQQGVYELVVTPSIGIALYPDHGSDAQTLLKNADAAMYEAKSGGRNQFRVYTRAMNVRATRRLSIEMDLRRAIEDSQLEVYYQPKYDAMSLQLTGVEALLRWFHAEQGQMPTTEFITIAEDSGLIGDLDRWVMSRVCADVREWTNAGGQVPSIAVNISGRNFALPDALGRISGAVERAGLPPSIFELELTEGVLMQDAEGTRRSLLGLKEFGFKLAVDDFGTGYCSLSYLKRFPLDILKIDRSFIADITVHAADAAIVRAVIALAHHLDLAVVAEGVATALQLKFLQDTNCDAVQGYLLNPALPARTLLKLLRAEPGPAEKPAEYLRVKAR